MFNHCINKGIGMNQIQKGKTQISEEHFPGCLGRVVNLFDLNIGIAGNKMLMDKQHQDGFPTSGKSHMARPSPYKEQIEDKEIVPKSSATISNRKSNGTPMKMLIAQEMSKEINNKPNPPSVVARLMGLDTLPSQQPGSSKQRDYACGSARVHADPHLSCCNDNKSGTLDAEQDQCKDIFEVSLHPKCSLRNKLSESGRCDEKDKRIAYVRQKFIEAKTLSIDEKCRQTNQFQDALEVLSSNTDLFLKFLQEPNPMFSQQISNLQSSLPPTDIKRITVLRPSKMVDNCVFSGKVMTEKHKNSANQLVSQLNKRDESGLDRSVSTTSCNVDGNATQPTRIVVLKPSTGKSHNHKVGRSPPCIPAARLHHENVLEDNEDKDAQASRELAAEITLQMHKNLVGHPRDEAMLSSMFPDGYISDGSSFNKSENEYAMGNLSDSEVMSPASRHSWDFINRIKSLHSFSSLTPASYSPESLVSREAKKRLSERWAMVASNGVCQEQRPLWKSSSTLGEMLSLSDANKSGKLEGAGDKEARELNSNQVSDTNMMEGRENYPRNNLLRSNSVPGPSITFSSQLKVDCSESEAVKAEHGEETINERSIKSSLKWKVSGLFSRNKKPMKQKLGTSKSGDEPHFGEKRFDSPGVVGNNVSQCLNSIGHEGLAPYVHGSSGKTTSTGLTEKQGIRSSEVEPGPSVKRDRRCGIHSDNQDQPSPISVLETSFEEDEYLTLNNIKSSGHGELPVHSVRSNLIDKSPPIGSIARTLSWDDSWLLDTATSLSLKLSSTQRTEEEHEWFFYVQKILSEAGLDEVRYDSFLSHGHSPESPLDPSLRDKYIDSHEEESLHESWKRKRRSSRKLVFDCVNAVLMDISSQNIFPCNSVMLVDYVWEQMREWFSWNMVSLSSYGAEGNSPVVQKMVAMEMEGKGWIQSWKKLEWESIGKEIEGKLLEEIVREAVVEMMN